MRPEIKNLPFSGQPLGTESYEKYQEYQPHVSVSAAKKKVLLTDLQDKHVTRNTESALFKDTTWNRKL